MSEEYDFIVIGGGSAGYAAARTVREASERVAIVDGAGELGGLCILRGCMPSKTLLYIAEILHHARHGHTFGLEIPSPRGDMAAVHERKKRIIGEFAADRVEELESDRFDLYRVRAHFINERTIELEDGRELSARGFLVSTGSKINYPPVPGLDLVSPMSSDDILDLDRLPDSVIVLGGGVVACELSQYLCRMGSRITQIQRSPLILKEASSEAANVLMQAFRDDGIELFTGTRVTGMERNGSGVKVSFEHEGCEKSREAGLLFNALGRFPDTADLGLDQAGVELLPSGHIVCNSFQQSTNPRIYAAGDCTGPHEIVHVAILQGEVAGMHFTGKNPDPVNYDHLTKVVFTDPQVASVGMPVAQLEADGKSFISAEYPFNDHGKSILMEANYGYVKIWAAPEEGRILGAECVGKDAGELIHSLAVAVSLNATVFDLLKTHWYHPTLSEIWTYPLEQIEEKRKRENKRV